MCTRSLVPAPWGAHTLVSVVPWLGVQTAWAVVGPAWGVAHESVHVCLHTHACAYVFVHVCACVCMHTYAGAYMLLFMHVYSVCAHVCTHACVHACVCTLVCMCTYHQVHMHWCSCVCACMPVCAWVRFPRSLGPFVWHCPPCLLRVSSPAWCPGAHAPYLETGWQRHR